MFERHFDEGLGRASYVLACPRAREAVIVDPRRDVDVYLAAARRLGVRIAWAVQTHLHDDFACGARELGALGANVIAGPGASLRYQHHEALHGERLRVGDLSIEFMHTPGHTPEHLCMLTSQPDQPVRLFTGDTLTAGGVGRPAMDDEAENRRLAEALHESLFARILRLHDRIHVHPGPGAITSGGGGEGDDSTTIGRERLTNPMLQIADRAEFVAAVLADRPARPPSAAWIRQMNQAGLPLLTLVNGYRRLTAISPASAALGRMAGGIVVDLRSAADFAAGHVRGALNLEYGSAVGASALQLLPPDPRIVLVAADPRQARDAARQLLRIGVSRIDGYIRGGFESWKAAGLPTGHLG